MHQPPITQTVADITERFEQLSAVRDQAINQGRQVIRLAANTIRALHRGDFEQARDLLGECSAILERIVTQCKPHPSIYWAGYVQDAAKEYAEAAITLAILHHDPVPTPTQLQVEDAAWLNGLAEAASELRRDVLDLLRAGDEERAVSLLDQMDAMYSLLVTVDFPDAITGGLRRTTDQLRAVLERTRGDVTIAVRQAWLERALRNAER